MSVEQEILVTGIKVVDLLAPYAKGGKIGESAGGQCIPLPPTHPGKGAGLQAAACLAGSQYSAVSPWVSSLQ